MEEVITTASYYNSILPLLQNISIFSHIIILQVLEMWDTIGIYIHTTETVIIT